MRPPTGRCPTCQRQGCLHYLPSPGHPSQRCLQRKSQSRFGPCRSDQSRGTRDVTPPIVRTNGRGGCGAASGRGVAHPSIPNCSAREYHPVYENAKGGACRLLRHAPRYSILSTPRTRRSSFSEFRSASSRTSVCESSGAAAMLVAIARPRTFMPSACAMMTSQTVDMPT